MPCAIPTVSAVEIFENYKSKLLECIRQEGRGAVEEIKESLIAEEVLSDDIARDSRTQEVSILDKVKVAITNDPDIIKTLAGVLKGWDACRSIAVFMESEFCKLSLLEHVYNLYCS